MKAIILDRVLSNNQEEGHSLDAQIRNLGYTQTVRTLKWSRNTL